MQQQHQHPLIVLMEDEIIHTDDHPFCSIDPTCGCHEDPELIAEVNVAVEQGLTHPRKQRSSSRANPSSVRIGAGSAMRLLLVHHRMVCDSPLSQLKGVFFP